MDDSTVGWRGGGRGGGRRTDSCRPEDSERFIAREDYEGRDFPESGAQSSSKRESSSSRHSGNRSIDPARIACLNISADVCYRCCSLVLS